MTNAGPNASNLTNFAYTTNGGRGRKGCNSKVMQGGVEKGTRRADSMPQRPRAGWGLIAAWCLNAALVCAENKVGPVQKREKNVCACLCAAMPVAAHPCASGCKFFTIERPHTVWPCPF